VSVPLYVQVSYARACPSSCTSLLLPKGDSSAFAVTVEMRQLGVSAAVEVSHSVGGRQAARTSPPLSTWHQASLSSLLKARMREACLN
jgi:hypothetical protein